MEDLERRGVRGWAVVENFFTSAATAALFFELCNLMDAHDRADPTLALVFGSVWFFITHARKWRPMRTRGWAAIEDCCVGAAVWAGLFGGESVLGIDDPKGVPLLIASGYVVVRQSLRELAGHRRPDGKAYDGAP